MPKHGKSKHAVPHGRPISTGMAPLEQKVRSDRPISNVYPTIDNDLARDNLENDLTEADLQDL